MKDHNRWYGSMVVRSEPLIKEYQTTGAQNSLKSNTNTKLPENLLQGLRKKPEDFPSISEHELVRHYYRLSRLNYSLDDGLYPLGSCTMKYNPVINEVIAQMDQFSNLHPALPVAQTQGALEILYETQSMISEILDLPGISLQPAAGAHGELAGVFMIHKYFESKGEKRNKILIPDSAHGTNPASAAMGGYITEKIPSNEKGLTDLEALAAQVDENTAALMITNPNTLGIFETQIVKIKEILDKKGALLYVDGANLNAVMGIVSFGKMGVDLTQLNLHKTFSTPHGGGGPGQGALACSERMRAFLPSPYVVKKSINGKNFYDYETPEHSIGPVKGWYGQFGIILRAWSYLKRNGKNIKEISERAVINANYIRKKLEKHLTLASTEPSMHEVVFNQKSLEAKGAATKNFAKALLDRGFYAPTIYFPLHVVGAIMVEPTETESKKEMDVFIHAVLDIFETLEKNPDEITQSPHNTYVREIDETLAARKPVLTWHDDHD
ncbi:MAG: aminomethyl-transferring glycine dehydrogenase subunit GcvPB [Spirochaetia bacterium]|nr:aminomethyl-transferring glycine dehydrogenase subunit GcvPB [Spirochaetia bacterium]